MNGSLYRFLVARGNTGAEDLAAETFAIAFRRRASYDLARPDARGWLYGIAINLARNQRRGERRRLRALGRLWDRPVEPHRRALARLEVAGPLADALRELRPDERDLLLLHACAEFTYEELAHALALPLGTVRSRLHRARLKVRKRLEGADDGP